MSSARSEAIGPHYSMPGSAPNDRVASKGIGLAIVRTLANEGMKIVGGALTVDALEGSKASLPSRSI
jgi:hypothetical protein